MVGIGELGGLAGIATGAFIANQVDFSEGDMLLLPVPGWNGVFGLALSWQG